MKKAILIAAMLLAALPANLAHAEEKSLTVLLDGGPEADTFQIELSPDGRTYQIKSNASLEVGGSVCWHAGGSPSELLCEAPPIGGFEVNGEGGDDVVEVDAEVTVPVTLSGGPGDDTLAAGGGNDKLLGGDGIDRLIGGGGNDLISGGAGPDVLLGGAGNDTLQGEGGSDTLGGGPGNDLLLGGPGRDKLYGGGGNDRLNGGAGHDALFGGPGDDRFIEALDDSVVGGPGRDVAVPGGVLP